MTGHEVCELAGISYQQLSYWTSRGYLHRTPGHGRQRVYDAREVRAAVHMGALVAAGVEVAAAHDVARGDSSAIARLETALEAVLA